jgi:hypothetical protein
MGRALTFLPSFPFLVPSLRPHERCHERAPQRFRIHIDRRVEHKEPLEPVHRTCLRLRPGLPEAAVDSVCIGRVGELRGDRLVMENGSEESRAPLALVWNESFSKGVVSRRWGEGIRRVAPGTFRKDVSGPDFRSTVEASPDLTTKRFRLSARPCVASSRC